VQNIISVKIVHSIANLVKFLAGLLLLEFLVHFYGLIQRAFFHVLHHDVEVGPVAEKAIHFDDVGMVGKQVYLYLLHELV